jgi:large subunit ribosomal protein L24e
VDNRSFIFLSNKCATAFLARRNPRRTNWTVTYRRLHRKGSVEEASKKKSRKVRKFQRGVLGATLDDISAKRNQKPEVRTAQRLAAIKESKDKAKAKQAERKATTGKPAAGGADKKAQQAAAKAQQKKTVVKQPKSSKVQATSR